MTRPNSANWYQVAIVGPMADDPSWQARAGEGFAKADFRIDWDRQVATCPAGHPSVSWLPNTYPKNGVVWEARFSRQDCTPCPHRAQCTRAKKEPRILGLQARDQHETLQAARAAQTTEAFREQYASRAGVESTHEQAIRRCGLRQCRYIGFAKTHLQHLVTAVAINLISIGDWVGRNPHSSDPLFAVCRPSRCNVNHSEEFATSVKVGITPIKRTAIGDPQRGAAATHKLGGIPLGGVPPKPPPLLPISVLVQRALGSISTLNSAVMYEQTPDSVSSSESPASSFEKQMFVPVNTWSASLPTGDAPRSLYGDTVV